MLEYILIFILAGLVLFSTKQGVSSILNTTLIIIMILMSGLRDMIGGFDVYIYSEVYEALKGTRLYLYSFFEKGFLSYYWLIQHINESREFMLFFSSALIIGGHLFIIRKFSPFFGFSLFIYFGKFFLFSFTYIRQELAMLVIWAAFYFLVKKKYFWVALLSLIGLSIHTSAIIFIPFLFIAYRRFSTLQLGVIFILVFLFFLSPFANLFLGQVAETSGNEKFAIYASKENSVNVFYILEALLLSFLIFKTKIQFYKNKIGIFLFNGIAMYIMITLASLSNPSFLRFSWYFYFFVIVGIPYIYLFTKTPQLKTIIKLGTFLFFFFLYFRLLAAYGEGGYYPYKNIFQDFDRHGQYDWMEYRQRYPHLQHLQ